MDTETVASPQTEVKINTIILLIINKRIGREVRGYLVTLFHCTDGEVAQLALFSSIGRVA